MKTNLEVLKLFKAASINAIGIIFGQGLLLVYMPLIAWRYSPDEYGDFYYFIAIVSILFVSLGLRLDVLIPSLKKFLLKKLVQCYSIFFLFPLLILICIALIFEYIANEESENFWFLVSFSGLAQASLLVYTSTSIGLGNFWTAAILRCSQPILFCLISYFNEEVDLILCWFLSCCLGLVFAKVFFLNWWIGIQRKRDINYLFKRMLRRTLFLLFLSILDNTTLALPLILIKSYFGDYLAGNFSQIQKLFSAPNLLLAAALTQVYISFTRDNLKDRREIYKVTVGICTISFFVYLLSCFLIVLIGDNLVLAILGDEWKNDKSFIILVTTVVSIRLLVSPVTGIFIVRNKLPVAGAWQISYFFSSIMLLTFCAQRYDFNEFLIILLINELVFYSVYLYLVRKVINDG